jgi:glycosyltransferase involved in cell wall biosynthesis
MQPGGQDAATCDFTFLFPAWNEEAGIERAVGTALEVGRSLTALGTIDSFEVVVVDDASTDRTAEIVSKLGASSEEVRLLRHDRNRKLGAALRTGFDGSRGRLVLYTDADLPFDLFEVERAIRLMGTYDADVVAGYRHDRTGEGALRWLYSFVYGWLVRLALGLRVRDVNFAAKLIHRQVLEATELRSDGSFIDAELLARVERGGFRIVQIGLDYFPRSRGVSTLSTPSVILRMLVELYRLRSEIRTSGAPAAPSR